jgi:hypothetical protein
MNGMKHWKTVDNLFFVLHLDESLFALFTSNAQLSSVGSTGSVKQQNYIPIKSYANMLLDDSELSVSTNFINEQHQPMLLIDECDHNS